MSKQKNGNSKFAASAVVATVIVAIAATAAVVVLMMSKNPKSGQNFPGTTTITFKPTQELADECEENSQKLLIKNYEVIKLFVVQGVPHLPEPYGNSPESGYFEADSSDYKTFEQIEELVKSVYTAQEAQRVLTKMPADPSSAEDGDLIAVYAVRKSLNDGSYVLGVNELFKPDKAYNKNWSSISIKAIPTSEDECNITVYLGEDASNVSDSDILNTKMVKENGEWRLTQLVY